MLVGMAGLTSLSRVDSGIYSGIDSGMNSKIGLFLQSGVGIVT